MNWNDIKYFLAVSRAKSLSGAARELGVKHSTVARRIQALEQHLETRLFDRLRHGYEMTQTAEHLHYLAMEVEDRVLQIDRKVTGLDSALSGTLKVTIAHELANRLVIPDLVGFNKEYPNIDLQLLMTKSMADLDIMEADIAIRMTPSPPEHLVGRELAKIHHGIYAHESLFKNGKHQPNVILFRDENNQTQWVKQHFKDSSVGIRVDDVGSMAIAVKSGLGVAKLPCFIGDTEHDLRRINVELGTSKWGIWMLNHVDLRETARVRACKQYLQKVFENRKAVILGSKSRYLC